KGITTVSNEEASAVTPFPVALYNLVPGVGMPARFGFSFFGTTIVLDAKLHSRGGYRVSIVSDPPAALVIQGNRAEFWGDPASPIHDPERFCPGQPSPFGGGPSAPEGCEYTRPENQAFLRNPTSCTAPGEGLTTTMRADSWFEPGAWVEKSTISH